MTPDTDTDALDATSSATPHNVSPAYHCDRCAHEANRPPPDPMDPAGRVARAHWDASRRRDPSLPRWEGLAVDLRRNRVADYQTMLDAGWVFTPPE